MSARIDITEVEQATKIRAKYLRAIENEEWSLLPGSTFVKSFIREYADYLDLDSRSLVEEYKLRYERPSENELRAVSPGLSRDRGRSSRGGGSFGGGRGMGGGGGGSAPRWLITVALLAIIVGALFVVGSLGGDDDRGGDGGTTTTQAQTTPSGRRGASRRGSGSGERRQPQRRAAAPTQAGLRLTPTGDVYVCLVDQDGSALINGTIYRAGDVIPVQRARAMRLTLGNGNVQVRVNGRAVEVPASSTAIGFAIDLSGARPLPEDQQPLCT